MGMKYTSLGRTGLQVSRLCLGGMMFGQRTNEADSARMIAEGSMRLRHRAARWRSCQTNR